MNAKAATETYLRETVETAPPIKIVRMLYQGAIRCLTQAAGMEPGEAAFGEQVARAHDIVMELRLALRPEHAPEQCERLEVLYLFVERQLLDARTARSTELLAGARQVLETLLEAWQQVDANSAAA